MSVLDANHNPIYNTIVGELLAKFNKNPNMLTLHSIGEPRIEF